MRIQRALVFACLLFAAPALGDAYDATLARAIAAKERALDTNDPADWEDALQLFQQADRLRSTKETKYELGSAAAKLRQDDLAFEAFETALALGLEATARDKAQAFIDEKKDQLGRLEIAGPEGAEIWIGTRQRGTLPLGRPLVVFAGPNRVRAAFEGREARLEVGVTAGAVSRADFAPLFEPPPTTPPPTAPPPTVTAPPTAPPAPSPTEADDGAKWALLIGGGATAAIGAALVIGASSSIDRRRDRLADLCAVQPNEDECSAANPGQRDAAQSEVDSIATWKSVRVGGWIGVGVGAAAAVTGLVLFATGGDSPEEPRTGWSLTPVRSGAVLSVSGRL